MLGCFGEQGHPLRATVAEMGPLLLSRILNLNDTQTGVLTAVFKIADDKGPVAGPKDPRAMLAHAGENAKEYMLNYGNISSASIGAIQRGILTLESQGGEKFFGEPALNLSDLMQTVDGKGVGEHSRRRQTSQQPAHLRDIPALAAVGIVRNRCRKWATRINRKLVFFFDEVHPAV